MKSKGSSRGASNLQKLGTERSNIRSANLDTKSALQIARLINSEDAKVAPAVKHALPQIAKAIDIIAKSLKRGGRLIYVGAGTSGRIAALDAAECPPTFHTRPETVQFVMAGGSAALGAAVEASEDSRDIGARDMASRKPGKNDVVVGIAASGRTPYTIAAVQYARQRGAKTVAVTCNPNSALEKAAHLAVVVDVGPEVLAGSTRMKAGSAQKMVLNMLSTGAMVRLGYVYGNLMVNVQVKNQKLLERGISILQQITKANRATAARVLGAANHRVPVALVMLLSGVGRSAAERVLRDTGGHVRQAIAEAMKPALPIRKKVRAK
jgi:N-acetylmuramic acid 6-phosphate etherase